MRFIELFCYVALHSHFSPCFFIINSVVSNLLACPRLTLAASESGNSLLAPGRRIEFAPCVILCLYESICVQQSDCADFHFQSLPGQYSPSRTFTYSHRRPTGARTAGTSLRNIIIEAGLLPQL